MEKKTGLEKKSRLLFNYLFGPRVYSFNISVIMFEMKREVTTLLSETISLHTISVMVCIHKL